MKKSILVLFSFSTLVVFTSCGSDDPSAPTSELIVGNDGKAITTAEAGIRDYVLSKDYKQWYAEPEVRSARGTSPHGNARVYFNAIAKDALTVQTIPMPRGAMLVKEVYGTSTTALSLYAVMVKSDVSDWTWWEASASNPGKSLAYGINIGGCKNCHTGSGNSDQVLTPLP